MIQYLRKIFSKRLTKPGIIFCFLIALFCQLLSFSSGSLHSNISIYDEAQHIDYSIHLAGGHVPVYGTELTDNTRRLIYCYPDAEGTTNGMPNVPAATSACTNNLVIPFNVPHGYNYEAQQPFLGYLPYAVAWDLLGLSSKNPSTQLVSLRLVNIFWAIVSFLSLMAIYRRFRPRLDVAISGILFLYLNPLALYSISYVTNDSSAIATGLFSVNLYYWLNERIAIQKRISTLFLYGSYGVILSLLRATYVLIPVLVLLGIITFRNKLSNYKILRYHQLIQLLLTISTTILYQLVIRFADTVSTATVLHVVNPTSVASPLTFQQVTSTISAVSGIFSVYWWPPPIGPFQNLIYSGPLIIFLFLCAGITLINLIHPIHLGESEDLMSAMAPATISTFFLFSLFFTFLYFVINQGAQWAPPRYLLPIFPFLLVPILNQLMTNKRFIFLFNTVGIVTLLSLIYTPFK
jgi:hypothetical protein